MHPWQKTWGRGIKRLIITVGIGLSLIPAASFAQSSVTVITRTAVLGGGSKLARLLESVPRGNTATLLKGLEGNAIWADPEVMTLLEAARAGHLEPFAPELAALNPSLVPLVEQVAALPSMMPASAALAGNAPATTAATRMCGVQSDVGAVMNRLSEAGVTAAWSPDAANPLLSAGRGVPPNQIVVILGASGDLTRRLVMPAYLNLAADGQLPAQTAIVGFSNAEWTNESFRSEMADAVREFDPEKAKDDALWRDFSDRLFYEKGDLTSPQEWAEFKSRLDEMHAKLGTDGNTVFHFAIPPSIIGPVTDAMIEAGVLNLSGEGPFTRVVIEKPFGHDLASSSELVDIVHPVAASGQLFRIDHYLGREAVQLILGLRSEGTVEPLLNNRYVTRVEINGMESIGIEGRGQYFEQSGIMRDMVQSHLIQLTALTMVNFDDVASGGDLIQRKIAWLRRLNREKLETVRAQYSASADGSIPNYLDEEGVPDNSTIETFVAMKLEHNTNRWKGVPIYLRSAKGLPEKRNDITFYLKGVTPELAESLGIDAHQPAALKFHIDPEPKIVLYTADKEFVLAVPGAGPAPTSYQRLISEYLHGQCGLFVSCAEVTASWRLFDRMLQQWASDKPGSLPTYPAGTTGPAEADALLPPGFGSLRPVVGKN